MKRIACIGDLHGCLDELIELYARLEHESLDAIYICGDYVDRGPDSQGTVQFCRERGIRGIAGNHDRSLLDCRKRELRDGYDTTLAKLHGERRISFEKIRDERDWAYLESLPTLHAVDSLNLVLVHGGLFPKMALYHQPEALVTRLQMIHPLRMDHTLWFNRTRDGKPEQELRNEGYVRWYELYDHKEDVVYGHSVFGSPQVVRGKGGGTSYGIDTGCVFGGRLSAVIFPDVVFHSVKAHATYCEARLGIDSSYGVAL